jgi:hypothetical protein
MAPEKILLACEKYKGFLAGYKPIKFPTAELVQSLERDCRDYNREKSLQHAKWMCTIIEEQVSEGAYSKAERWLCFIQGVLWMNGVCTIDEMRDDNREG